MAKVGLFVAPDRHCKRSDHLMRQMRKLADGGVGENGRHQ